MFIQNHPLKYIKVKVMSILNKFCALTHVAQFGLNYACLNHPSVTKDVNRMSLLFATLNCGFLFMQTVQPDNSLSKYQNWGILAVGCLAGGLDYKWLNQPYNIRDPIDFDIPNLCRNDGSSIKGKIEVRANRPTKEKLKRAIFIAQLVQALVGIYFSRDKLLRAIQLSATVGSLFQLRLMRWIELKHSSPQTISTEYNILSAPTISVHTLLPFNSEQNNTCNVCTENQSDTYYCSNAHPTCTSCLIEWYTTKIKNVATELFDRSLFTATDHFENRVYKRTSYTFKLSGEHLPSCPICRETPSHAVYEFHQGKLIINNANSPASSFWTANYSLYSVIQLSLAFAQYTHPNLAGPIYKMQKLMLMTDAVLFGVTLVQEMKNSTISLKSNHSMQIALALSILFASALLYQSKYGKHPSLVQVIKDRIAETEFASLSIDQKAPLSFNLLKSSLGARALLTLGLAISSKRKSLLLFAGLLNVFALLTLSQMQWIHLKKAFSKLSGYDRLTTAEFHILLPNPHKIFKTSPLPDLLVKLNEYVSNFFDKSSWNVYWSVTKQNGVEISRTLCFDATVKPSPLNIGGIDFYKLIREWGGACISHSGTAGALSIQAPNCGPLDF